MLDLANILANIPASLSEELVQILLATDHVRIERIVSLGHASPEGFWYDQDMHEWVLLLQGAARLRFEGEAHCVTLKAGDYLDIPAHKRHRVEWTDPEMPTVWLALHYVSRTQAESIAANGSGSAKR